MMLYIRFEKKYSFYMKRFIFAGGPRIFGKNPSAHLRIRTYNPRIVGMLHPK